MSAQDYWGNCWGSLVRPIHLLKKKYEWHTKLLNMYLSLTLAATAFCWARHRLLPKSITRGWVVRKTRELLDTTTTAVTVLVIVKVLVIEAVQVSKELRAGLTNSGRLVWACCWCCHGCCCWWWCYVESKHDFLRVCLSLTQVLLNPPKKLQPALLTSVGSLRPHARQSVRLQVAQETLFIW